MRTYFRWIGAAACISAFMWALKVTDGNTFKSINATVRVMLAFYAIDMCFKYRNKMKESGLSGDQLWLQNPGSPEKLLKQGKILLAIACVFVAGSLGLTLFGVVMSSDLCLVIGGITCVIFLPFAAFLFWAAYKSISIAKRAGIAQLESLNKQEVAP